jgi:hypothetical protein
MRRHHFFKEIKILHLLCEQSKQDFEKNRLYADGVNGF